MFLRWLWLVVEFSEVVRRFCFLRTQYTIKLLQARELRTNPHHSKTNKFQANRQICLYTLFRTARPKNHTLSSGTKPYNPNKGVATLGTKYGQLDLEYFENCVRLPEIERQRSFLSKHELS